MAKIYVLLTLAFTIGCASNPYAVCDKDDGSLFAQDRNACIERVRQQENARIERERKQAEFMMQNPQLWQIKPVQSTYQYQLPVKQNQPTQTNCSPDGVGGFRCTSY